MKKNEFRFGVSIETNDRTGKVLAVYFRVRDKKVAKTKECEDGIAYADYDRDGNLVGVELLGPCSVTILDKIAKQKTAREFMRNSAPRGMLVPA